MKFYDYIVNKKLVSIIIFIFLVSILCIGCSADTSQEQEIPQEELNETQVKQQSNFFPNKPITIMTGYKAGSVTDLGLRLLVPYLEEELGQRITVLNKPGGGGWIAWNELAKAEPDGYTLSVVNAPNFHTGYLNPELKRDYTVRDFDFIANHVLDPSAISVRIDSEFNSIDDIVNYAREHPNELSITTTGPATDDHIMALMLENYADAKFNIVHCEGGNESVQQVLGGHIDILCENVGGVMVPLMSKEVKMLGVATEERNVLVPDVPTLKEQGYDFVTQSARGIATPKGIPDDIKEILANAFEKAMNNPEHIEKMKEIGLTVEYLGPDEYTKFMYNQEKAVEELLIW